MAKKRVQWLIEHSASYQLLYWVDSLVLRNTHLRQSPKRYKIIISHLNLTQKKWFPFENHFFFFYLKFILF
ncbi:MAG: hypothetical protein EA341_15925 [Mongoliibacter sp.]|nr:MAG: hypothetical protein EA341_15925 [Mongoliibacter sp.]